jgi:hypothetical protein
VAYSLTLQPSVDVKDQVGNDSDVDEEIVNVFAKKQVSGQPQVWHMTSLNFLL